MSGISILLLLGIGQGALLGLVFLVGKVGANKANCYLGALTLLLTLSLVDILFLDEANLALTIFLWPKEYLYGPLLYFYVRGLTSPNTYFLKSKQWLHFLPAILHIVISWSLFSLDSSRQHQILESSPASTMPDELLAFLLGDFEAITAILHIGIYLALSLHVLRQHSFRIKHTFSYTEKISLNWLRFLMLGMGIIYLVWSVAIISSQWLELEGIATNILELTGLIIVALVYVTGYLGLRQPEIFTPIAVEGFKEEADLRSFEEANVSNNQKYKKSALSYDHSKSFLEELELLMHKEKPYLDNKLSLPQLAKELNISVNYLSQTINEQKKQSFFDFINSYRIDDAKNRLTQPNSQKINILTIAMDSGFNSKSSFYTAFRKHTGVTPGQYRKSQ